MMDFSKLRFNCTNLSKIIKQDSKKVLTDKNLETLDVLKKKSIIKDLCHTDKKKYDYLLSKINYEPTDLIMNSGVNYLKFLYLTKKYGSSFTIKGGYGVAQMIRGVKSEPESIKLLEKYFDRQFFSHKSRLYNDKIVGSLDITDSDKIENSNKIIEVKTTFSHLHFLQIINKPLLDKYLYQMQGYFYLTGIDYGEVCFCLTDYPQDMIDEQRQIMHSQLCPNMCLDETNDTFISEWDKAYKSLTFNHVPIKERVIIYPVRRNNNIISDIVEKVDICRDWLSNFDQIHSKFFSEQYEQKNNIKHYPTDMGEGNTKRQNILSDKKGKSTPIRTKKITKNRKV